MGVLAVLQRAGARKSVAAGTGAPLRVLVIGDNQKLLGDAEGLLAAEGHLPISISAPQAAVQTARSMRPGAILLDVLMPGFDGWDVLAALKGDPMTTAIPVIMIAMLGERRRALAAGASGVVDRPLGAGKLRAALGDLAPPSPRRAQSSSR